MKQIFRPLILALTLCAAPVLAQVQMGALNPKTERAIRDVVTAANRSFGNLPQVRMTSAIGVLCGGDGASSGTMRYCTDQNVIFVAADLEAQVDDPRAAAYRMAHMFGHAVQVRHGVADVALATISANRDREAELRTMVTSQVECIAGVLYARAGIVGGRPSDWFAAEPFVDSHWGRSPMSNGPIVSIGLSERDRWFTAGRQAGDFAVCAVGEFGAELILRAER